MAVRPGDHACCRFARPADRRRLLSAFVADSVRRGHRVVHLAEDDPPEVLARSLAADDPAVAAALATRRVEIRPAAAVYLPGGVFDADGPLALMRSLHERALRDGCAGLSVSGDGRLAAARVHDEGALRLAGALDFRTGPDLARVLDAHVHGDLRVDLDDVEVVDVAGLRVLRRRTGRRLVVLRASEPVRRLAALLAWDTDGEVELEP